VDVWSDPDNCGECGAPCPQDGNHVCAEGQCRCYSFFDDFESGDFSRLAWQADRWVVSQGVAQSAIQHIQSASSSLRLRMNVPAGTISFRWRVQSEQCCDHLRFTIDGMDAVQAIQGQVDWTEVETAVAAGDHDRAAPPSRAHLHFRTRGAKVRRTFMKARHHSRCPASRRRSAIALACATALALPGSIVLGNDIELDHQAMTARLVSGPAHGQLVLNQDGSFTYTPGADFPGTDSFVYEASDGQADSNQATVTLSVRSPQVQVALPSNRTSY
jgi:hypothetical protein